jgi:hypothetical protein
MIPPYLEKLIWEGKANYKSYAIGSSGVAVIPFPKGARALIVYEFTWFPFCDEVIDQNVTEANLVLALSKLVHTLTLWNGKQKAIYNFRDTFALNNNINATNYRTPNFCAPTIQPCYYSSKEDIRVNIFNFPREGLNTINYDVIPATTQEQPSPNGYGGQPAVRSVFLPSGQYIPLGRTADPGAIPIPPGFFPGQRERYEYFGDIDADTVLIRPNGRGYSYPLVNFNCVEIYDRPNGVFP